MDELSGLFNRWYMNYYITQKSQKNIDTFNKSKTESFRLSVVMGSECFDGKSMENFLSEMDFNMYKAKRQYHDSKKM